jgi:hypothetical protein
MSVLRIIKTTSSKCLSSPFELALDKKQMKKTTREREACKIHHESYKGQWFTNYKLRGIEDDWPSRNASRNELKGIVVTDVDKNWKKFSWIEQFYFRFGIKQFLHRFFQFIITGEFTTSQCFLQRHEDDGAKLRLHLGWWRTSIVK